MLPDPCRSTFRFDLGRLEELRPGIREPGGITCNREGEDSRLGFGGRRAHALRPARRLLGCGRMKAPHALTLVLSLAACAASGNNARTPRAPASAPSRAIANPRVDDVRHYRVRWDDILRVTGCFFFSGPKTSGRDNKLGDRARLVLQSNDRATLIFGAISFFGSSRGGAASFERKSDHTFNGKWRTTEKIALHRTNADLPRAFGGGRFKGSYSYRECELKKGRPCPGRCTIEARLELVPEP